MSAELLLNTNPNLITDANARLALATINNLIADISALYQKHTDESLPPETFAQTLLVIEQDLLLLSAFNTIYSGDLIQVYTDFYQLNNALLEYSKTVIQLYPEIFIVLNRVQNRLRVLLTYQYYNQEQMS